MLSLRPVTKVIVSFSSRTQSIQHCDSERRSLHGMNILSVPDTTSHVLLNRREAL